MNEKINIGIIGAGVMGERFIKAAKKHSRVNISGIYDTNLERLDHISNEYDIPTVKEYSQLIDNNNIDLIYIAVPPKYHYHIALEVIEKNKHIICEKPLANSTEEVKDMAQKANEKNIVHAINFPTIYSAAFEKMNSLLNEGFIGQLRRVEYQAYFSEWPRPWQQNPWIGKKEQGGFIREVFSHYVQMIQRLFSELKGIDTKLEFPNDPLASESGVIATAYLKDKTPVLLNSFSDIGMKEEMAFTIYGTKGSLSLVNWNELWASSKDTKQTKVELENKNNLLGLIDDVLDAIDNKNSNIVTFDEGRDVHLVIEKLLGRD